MHFLNLVNKSSIVERDYLDTFVVLASHEKQVRVGCVFYEKLGRITSELPLILIEIAFGFMDKFLKKNIPNEQRTNIVLQPKSHKERLILAKLDVLNTSTGILKHL